VLPNLLRPEWADYMQSMRIPDEPQKAHRLDWKDFEDAVVAVMAEEEACDYIVTRDLGDFSASTIPAISPEEALRILQSA